MHRPAPLRLAVLVSGGGRTLANLLERIAETQPDEYSYEPGPNDVPLLEVVSAITAAQRNTTSNAGAGTSHANDADDAG